MKLSKILFGCVAATALIFGFAGCSEDDNDENGAISGSGKNYTVNYTNTDTVNHYRSFNTTTFKHLGELVKVEVNYQEATSKDGAMGFIWDLQKSSKVTGAATTDAEAQNFFLAGVRNYNGTIQFYISKYFNVTDINANNFGASTYVASHDLGIAATEPKELMVSDFTTLCNFADVVDSSNSTMTVWMDVYPVFAGSKYGADIASHAETAAGAYVVDFYNADPTDKKVEAKKLKSVVIQTDVTGYTAKPKQQSIAVYSIVYSGETLRGSYYLAKDYAEADVVEE